MSQANPKRIKTSPIPTSPVYDITALAETAKRMRAVGVLRFRVDAAGGVEMEFAPLIESEQAIADQRKIVVPADLEDAPRKPRDPREPKGLDEMSREELEGFSLPDAPDDGDEEDAT
jgi:hypothetical protein